MTKPTVAADGTALPDPIISLLSRWDAACDAGEDQTWREMTREMETPPKVATAAGALAAVGFALDEMSHTVDGYAEGFIKRAHRFTTRFLAGPDPILTAIAEHKRLWSAVTDAGDDDGKASGIETAYMDGMLCMVPATVPGLLAWLDYVLSEPGIGESDTGSGLNVVRATVRQFGTLHLGEGYAR